MPPPPSETGNSEVLPSETPTSDYYTGVYTDGSVTTNVIKCPEGSVFQGSNVLFETDEDKGVLKYRDGRWLREDGTPHPEGVWVGDSLTCTKKYCDSLGIVDSNKEYDVLIDNDNDDSYTVECNDGYVFDTTNHKLGNVKCGVIPEMTNDLSKDTTVAWIAHNPLLEEQCASKTMDQCINDNIDYIISDDIDQDYSAPGPGFKQLKCTWVPEINTDSPGNTSGLSRPGQCKFIHRVDFNKTEPACRSMYCSRIEIPNSDRIDGINGALPGPEEGYIHGNCVNFDGQILNQITNSSDCACFQHKSCDNCTASENCQWCGYSDTGEGGFCYSTRTHLSICDTSVRNDRGGTCTHVKTRQSRPNEPEGGWSDIDCNENVCVKKSYWDNLVAGDFNDELNDNYIQDRVTETDCVRDNNYWDENVIEAAPDHCVLSNNTLIDGDQNNTRIYNYYPKHTQASDTIQFNISDKICIPSDESFTNVQLQGCLNHTNKDDCAEGDGVDGAGSCSWVENPLRDSLFGWTQGVGSMSIHFLGSGEEGDSRSSNCPIIYNNDNDNRNNTNKLTFQVSSANDGYILLGADEGSGLQPSFNYTAINADNDYLTTCPMFQADRKIFSEYECSTKMSSSGTNVTYFDTPHTCDNGTKYCSDTTISLDDGSRACAESTVDTTGLNLPNGACPYYSTQAEAPDGYKCYGNNVEYECNPQQSYIEKYNCAKTIPPDNSAQCESTGYTIDSGDSNTPLKEINNYMINGIRFKNYINCKTNETDNAVLEQERCENIGSDLAHWGGYCNSDSDKLPKKQICELVSIYKDGPDSNDSNIASGGATWGKYINPSNNRLEWGCYKDNGEKYTDSDICDLATAAATASLLTGGDITSGSETTSSSEFISSSTEECIIDGAPNKTDYSESVTDVTSIELNNVCLSGQDHHIAFDFINNTSDVIQAGACKKLAGPTADEIVPGIDNQVECELNNNTWEQHYIYTQGNTCESTGPDLLRDQPDIPTNWTGGEISTDEDGLHRSECSPSIMSSCNVDCDSGYGGGGEYICQYNSEGGDVCEIINQKVVPNKDELCDAQPACHIDDDGNCVHNTNFTDDGHLEWIGSPCYKIDNTAFAHGIAKLPDLDVVFPPFARALLHSVIIILFGGAAIYIISKSLLWLGGFAVDKTFNTGLSSINKVINYVTVDNKIFDVFLSNKMRGNEKGTIFITMIGLFIGSYFLFDYLKDSVHDILHDIRKFLLSIVRRLKQARVAIVPPENVSIGDHAEDSLNNAETRIGIAFENAKGVVSDDEAMLTIVVQVGVLIIICIILFMFAMKGDDQIGILKKKLD